MKVVVTGAAGLIGSEVVRALLARGDEVVAPLRWESRRERLADVLPRLSVVDLELSDTGAVAAMFHDQQPEAVVHLAWYAGARDYLTSHENLTSLSTSLRFAEEAFSAGVSRFVGVGSCVEYAPSPSARREEDAIMPESLYAATKHGAHLALRVLAKEVGARLSWARIFHLHGPGEDPARLLPLVAQTLRAGQVMELSPGAQLRDHLHVADVASALATVLHSEAEGPLNVCSGVPVSLREVLGTLGDLLGRRELLRFGARPYREGEVMVLCGDASRLHALGWRPRFTTLEAGLRDALQLLPARP